MEPVIEINKDEPPTLIFQVDVGGYGEMLIEEGSAFDVEMELAFSKFFNKRIKVTMEVIA